MDEAVDGVDVPRIAPALVPDLQKFTSFSRSLDHCDGFSERIGHLLFAVDMEAGFQAGVGMFGMHSVRGGHYGDIQVLLLTQHIPVILVDVDLMPVFLEIPAGIPLAVFPDIADRSEADAGNAQAGFDQHTSLRACADDRHSEFRRFCVVLSPSGGSGSGQAPSSQGHSQTRGRRGFEKVPAGQFFSFTRVL